MKLTAQQEKFCQCIADGLNQADAYRSAYPKSQAWKADSVYSKAAQLIGNAKVAQRVAVLKEALASKQLWTREQSVAQLVKELDGDRAGDRINAVKELNNMHGYNAPTKLDIRGTFGVDVNFD
jgi:hypothetical protein